MQKAILILSLIICPLLTKAGDEETRTQILDSTVYQEAMENLLLKGKRIKGEIYAGPFYLNHPNDEKFVLIKRKSRGLSNIPSNQADEKKDKCHLVYWDKKTDKGQTKKIKCKHARVMKWDVQSPDFGEYKEVDNSSLEILNQMLKSTWTFEKIIELGNYSENRDEPDFIKKVKWTSEYHFSLHSPESVQLPLWLAPISKGHGPFIKNQNVEPLYILNRAMTLSHIRLKRNDDGSLEYLLWANNWIPLNQKFNKIPLSRIHPKILNAKSANEVFVTNRDNGCVGGLEKCPLKPEFALNDGIVKTHAQYITLRFSPANKDQILLSLGLTDEGPISMKLSRGAKK